MISSPFQDALESNTSRARVTRCTPVWARGELPFPTVICHSCISLPFHLMPCLAELGQRCKRCPLLVMAKPLSDVSVVFRMIWSTVWGSVRCWPRHTRSTGRMGELMKALCSRLLQELRGCSSLISSADQVLTCSLSQPNHKTTRKVEHSRERGKRWRMCYSSSWRKTCTDLAEQMKA